MNVREMTMFDLDQVMVIENENFSVPWTETGFFTYLMREDALFLVAEDEDENVVGYCGVIMSIDEGDITNVSVKKEYQGKGIGYSLMQEIIKQAKNQNCSLLTLEVRKSNLPARKLYEKCGMELVGERKNFYSHPTEAACIYTIYF